MTPETLSDSATSATSAISSHPAPGAHADPNQFALLRQRQQRGHAEQQTGFSA